MLMTVIHDWPDDEAIAILRAVRAAGRPSSRVIVIDSVVDDDDPDPFVADVDIAMLAITGGVERTRDELTALLTAAGFTPTATTLLPSNRAVVEARPI